MIVETMVIDGITQKKCIQLRRREDNINIYSADRGREALNRHRAGQAREVGGGEAKGGGPASRRGG